jgi:hypothetical protein
MTKEKLFHVSISGEDAAVKANANFITNRAGAFEIITTAEDVGTQVESDDSDVDVYKAAKRYAALVRAVAKGNPVEIMQTGSRVTLTVDGSLHVADNLAVCLDSLIEKQKNSETAKS